MNVCVCKIKSPWYICASEKEPGAMDWKAVDSGLCIGYNINLQ